MPADSRLPLASSASGRSRNWRRVTVSLNSKTSSPGEEEVSNGRPRFATSARKASSAAELNSSPLWAICRNSSSLMAEYTLAIRTRSGSGAPIVIARHHTRNKLQGGSLASTNSLLIRNGARTHRPQRGLRFLFRHPVMNTRAQHIHRQRSARQHLVMEGAQIELAAQFVF